MKEKLSDKIIGNRNPKKINKRQLRKYANKKMNGPTVKDRFVNFFTNKNGYYSWQEMLVNWLIVIAIVAVLVSGIIAAVNWKSISLATLFSNMITYCLGFAICFLVVLLFVKSSLRKKRFKCYINNGISDKYVFWKDDTTNPGNKPVRNSFK